MNLLTEIFITQLLSGCQVSLQILWWGPPCHHDPLSQLHHELRGRESKDEFNIDGNYVRGLRLFLHKTTTSVLPFCLQFCLLYRWR